MNRLSREAREETEASIGGAVGINREGALPAQLIRRATLDALSRTPSKYHPQAPSLVVVARQQLPLPPHQSLLL